MSEMTPERHEWVREAYVKLREPFPPAMIGTRDGFDFVGHAAVTDRLNSVDPAWTWAHHSGEPDITLRKIRDDKNGNPVFLAGMWILLTVCGVTRPAYGEVEQYVWSDNIEKRLISDAIKNGAMRFGVAIDLWAKEDLRAEPPVEAVSKAQVDQLSALLKPNPDAAALWKEAWGSVLLLPAASFEEAYGHAMDLVEAEDGVVES